MIAADVVRYRTDGYVAVRGRFDSAEVSVWRRECERLWDGLDPDQIGPRVQQRARVGGGKVIDRLDAVIELSPLFAALARDERILSAYESRSAPRRCWSRTS